jgi:hypothetical protein
MTTQEKDEIIVRALKTTSGKKKFRSAFELAAAKAADRFPEWSIGWMLGRNLADLPPKR